MPYTLIKGEFHIFYPDLPRQGPEPDGDTLKFRPDDAGLVDLLTRSWRGPQFNGRRMINLRFEGIDALELHFSEMHQNLALAEQSRDFMLDRAGFRQVQFWADAPANVQAVANNPQPGYILARSLDTFGRIIAFVYAGATNLQDGDDNVWVDVPLLNQSLNAKLMRAGEAYPSFYSTLPLDLKARLSDLAIQSWNADRGLWPVDTANKIEARSIPSLNVLQRLAIWPKLYRRLARYFAQGFNGLADFDSWLREDQRDRDDRVLLPDGELGNMHNVINVNGNRLGMNYWPEEITILPDD